jgi:hypothetical protein
MCEFGHENWNLACKFSVKDSWENKSLTIPGLITYWFASRRAS